MSSGDGNSVYSKLEDLKLTFDREDLEKLIDTANGENKGDSDSDGGGALRFCFWLYLSNSARPSSVIVNQITLESKDTVPFLTLNEENKLMILPLVLVHKEAPSTENSLHWTKLSHAVGDIDCPLERWTHVGCEVAVNYIHLYIDGKLVGEKSLSFLCKERLCDNLKRITLVGNDGNLGGYVYQLKLLHPTESISDQLVKNSPVKLSLDHSCLSDGIEEGDDGVWNIVGGKASCRRNFSLEILLLDSFGRLVHQDMELVASLVYADNKASVKKSGDDSEAPLLTSCDGFEFPSEDKPVALLHGHATFKLKISQLSSKCDNRLFHVCFHPLQDQRYPFLEAYSQPIRCISRSRTIKTLGFGKRSIPTLLPHEIRSLKCCDQSQVVRETCGNVHSQLLHQSALKFSPALKRPKVEHDRLLAELSEQALVGSSETKPTCSEGTDSAPSDSGSTDEKDYESRWSQEATFSDVMVFRYCLEGTPERLLLLKTMMSSTNDKEMANFAEKVCQYSGCSHHRDQILISKQLIQEGIDTWNTISRNKIEVCWADAAPEINRRFMKIANSADRALSAQDLQILQQIAGCSSHLNRESFEKMWYWLYPVAFALSRDQINRMWLCISTKWLEGLITKDEAENALKGPQGLKNVGTFLLRFPTSRSWPHPDAGSLLVTYVGSDFLIHHKLLSLDDRDQDSQLLQDMLLKEPELSQLGRVFRGNTVVESA